MATKQTCSVTGKEFVVSDDELEVLRRIGELNPVLSGEPLPLPPVHPNEAIRQIFSFSGLRYLFKTTSAVSGAPVITRYNPKLGIRVCRQEEFFSDVDNTDAGRPYDFNRGFFEQYFELAAAVINPPLNRTNCENSDFTNGAINLKDCYLCFVAFDSQDCLYCLSIRRCRDCVDLVQGADCELCFSSRDLVRCYRVEHSYDCRDSQELFGCLDCRSCSNCFGCVDLDHKQWHIFNKPVSREKYSEFIASQNLQLYSGRTNALISCDAFRTSAGHVPETNLNCNQSSGAYLERCDNVIESQGVSSSRTCGYLVLGSNNHCCFRGAGHDNEYFYCSNSYGAQVNAFCFTVFGGRNNLYSSSMYNSCSDCFGCIALNRKQYCILNRQYTREEYFELCPRIIASMRARGEWGHWFPPRYSWHYYQESGVHEYLSPIPLEEAARRGYRLTDELPAPPPVKAIRASDLPDELEQSIQAVSEKPILCARSSKAFNLQRKELDYLQNHRIPLPRLHWNERLQDLIGTRTLLAAA